MRDLPALPALDELGDFLGSLPGPDTDAAEAARARQMTLTKPPGSLGRLEDLAIFLAGWQGRERPRLGKVQAVVFAGNHGVCAQGVNPFPQEVTRQMVANFEAGGAAINQLCAAAGAELDVIALDLDRPTGDLSQGPAMTEAEAQDAMARGAASVAPDADLVILGEMGIGNSTVAAALAAALFGGGAARWVGPGTGADAEGIARKVAAIEAGLAANAPALGNPGRILAAFGGRELAAIAGAVIAARMSRTPVMLDGFICTAAAAPLHAAHGDALAHCLVAHASAEPGHRALLAELDKEPILDLGMRLGEGSGAAVAATILRAAVACHNGMATFAEAGVSGA